MGIRKQKIGLNNDFRSMIREYSNTVEEKLLQLERRLDKQREEHEKEIDAPLLALEAL